MRENDAMFTVPNTAEGRTFLKQLRKYIKHRDYTIRAFARPTKAGRAGFNRPVENPTHFVVYVMSKTEWLDYLDTCENCGGDYVKSSDEGGWHVTKRCTRCKEGQSLRTKMYRKAFPSPVCPAHRGVLRWELPHGREVKK